MSSAYLDYVNHTLIAVRNKASRDLRASALYGSQLSQIPAYRRSGQCDCCSDPCRQRGVHDACGPHLGEFSSGCLNQTASNIG